MEGKLVRAASVLLVMILLLVHCPKQALAADATWRMMHGEQDTIVVGIVKEVTGEETLIQVEQVMLCQEENSLNRQLPSEEIPDEITVESVRYQFSYHGKTTPEAGDFIIISADRKEEGWQQRWLALEVNSTELSSLEIVPKEELTASAYAWQLFIRTEGEINEFSYDQTNLYIEENGERKLVFSQEDNQEAPKKQSETKEPEKTEDAAKAEEKVAASVSVIGGADGPTSIFLAGKIGTTGAYVFLAIGIAAAAAAIVVAVIIYKKVKKKKR